MSKGQYTGGLLSSPEHVLGIFANDDEERLMEKKKRVAMVVANNFEDSEAIDPMNHL